MQLPQPLPRATGLPPGANVSVSFRLSALPSGGLNGGNAMSVAAGDLDGDGVLDMVVANWHNYRSTSNGLLMNNGRGAFTSSELIGGWADTSAVALGDFDGDGDLDVVLGSYNAATPNKLLLNNISNHPFPSNGSFSLFDLPGAAGKTQAIAVGDVDLNGHLDIVAVNENSNHQLLLGDGGGGFTATDLPSGPFVTSSREHAGVGLADLDNDGHPDIAIAAPSWYGGPGTRLLYNQGNGTFEAGVRVYAADTNSLALGDLDGDGLIDIIVANSQSGNVILHNLGGRTFVTVTLPGSSSFSTLGVQLGDVNNDGALDIVFSNNNAANQVLINGGSGDFHSINVLPGGTSNWPGIALGDFNTDGLLDLYIGNDQLLVNTGSASYISSDLPATGSYSLALADMNNDGALDATFTDYSYEAKLLVNDGSGSFTMVSLPTSGGNARTTAMADLNGDGFKDVLVGTMGFNTILLNNGGAGTSYTSSTLPGASSTQSGIYTSGFAFADVDGDGDLDVAVANEGGGNELLIVMSPALHASCFHGPVAALDAPFPPDTMLAWPCIAPSPNLC